MILPDDVVQIIREFSKPLTRPDWKKGTPHAKLIKYSEPMQSLKQSFEISYVFRNSWMYNIFEKDFYDDNITMVDIIQNHGEEIFSPHCGINFYIYARYFLNRTNLLWFKTTMYLQTRYGNKQNWSYNNYEWVHINE
jgi:hypothetical protein